MEMQPTRASSRLRKNNSMDDLCTGIATKCKPYTLDPSKAKNGRPEGRGSSFKKVSIIR
jgi:hypothetical protein